MCRPCEPSGSDYLGSDWQDRVEAEQRRAMRARPAPSIFRPNEDINTSEFACEGFCASCIADDSAQKGEGIPESPRDAPPPDSFLKTGAAFELMHLEARISGTPVPLLIDSGASRDFISWATVRKLNLLPVKSKQGLNVRLANGTRVEANFEVIAKLEFVGSNGTLKETRRFHVLNLGPSVEAILGQPWLQQHVPHINFRTQTAKIGDIILSGVGKTRVAEQDVPLLNVLAHEELNAILTEESAPPAFIAWLGTDRARLESKHKGSEVSTQLVPSGTASGDKKSVRRRRFRARQQGISTYLVVSQVERVGTPQADTTGGASEEEITESLNKDMERSAGFPEDAKRELHEFLRSHPGLTSESNVDLRRQADGAVIEHAITEVAGSTPPSRPAFRLGASEIATLKKELDKLLKLRFIRPSASPYGAPVLFVPKPDGTLRFVIDYRALNAQTVKDKYNLPRDSDLFDMLELNKATVMSSVDLKYGYWQVGMKKEDIPKTAIRTPIGNYEFLVMPMGLTNAPATFQRMMEVILRPLLAKSVMVYLDDVIIFSRTPEEHLKHVREVLELLHKHHLRVSLKKCEWFKREMKFLGHMVKLTPKGIELRPNPKKVKVLEKWEAPQSSKDVERFLGLANYYARLVERFAERAAPLMGLTGKNLSGAAFAREWKQEHHAAYLDLKRCLSSEPVVTLHNPDRPTIIQTDASVAAIGGALLQEDEDGERRVIAYFSHKFSDAERNWPTHEQELFGLVYALRKFRHYLVGHPIRYEGDHRPLQWVKTQTTLSRKQARWLETLESFDWEFHHVPGENLPVDVLSRPPGSDGLGEQSGPAVPLSGDFLSYLASCAEHDSLRLVEGGGGPSNVSDRLRDSRDDPTITWVDAEDIEPPQTSFAGKLFASNRILHLLKEAYQEDPKYRAILSSEHLTTGEGARWAVRNGVVYVTPKPSDRGSFPVVAVPQRARELQRLILREYHDVAVGGHLGASKMLERISRHFSWLTLREDVISHVKSCHACRVAKHRTVKPRGRPTGHFIPDRPFETLGLDLKTGLPTSRSGNDAFLVVVDRFTRYGHILPCSKKIDAAGVAKLVFDHVVRRWGFPRGIVSDRDPRFTAEVWSNLWTRAGTQLNMTTANRPQGDGGSERYIRTVVDLLRARVGQMKDLSRWDEEVTAIEFAYNDSVCPATGHTPFQLATGRDPLTPVSVLLHALAPSHSLYAGRDDGRIDESPYLTQYARTLSAARDTMREVAHAQRETLMKRASRQVVYAPGDYVYVKSRPTGHARALDPLLEGPFRVEERVGLCTYRLRLRQKAHPGLPQRHDIFNESELTPYVDRRTGLMWPPESREVSFSEDAWREKLRDEPPQEFRPRGDSRLLLAELLSPRHFDPRADDCKHPRILELCSGPNKPASRALRRRYPKAKVVTVDIDPNTHPDVVANIVDWTSNNLPWPPGFFDIIWASPPCTEYSKAKTTGYRDLESADAIVQAALRIIEALRPSAWFLENPRGMLRDRPFMQMYQGFRNTCTYCRYGTPYRKETDIWSNVRGLALQHCGVSPCAHWRKSKCHPQTAQGGMTRNGVPGTPREQAYEPPRALMDVLIGRGVEQSGFPSHDERRVRADWQLLPRTQQQVLQRYTPRGIPVAQHWKELFAADGNALCTSYWTEDDDAFKQPWTGGHFYGNPVYTHQFIAKTLAKALRDYEKLPTRTTTVLVLPDWKHASWYHMTRQFTVIQQYPKGAYLFTCPPWYLRSDSQGTSSPVSGRWFVGGTPWPVIVIGIGLRPHGASS